MPTAVSVVRSNLIPVTPKKRYRFFIEWASDSTSNAITVAIRWFDGSQSTLSTVTILNVAADAANTWQVNARHVIPPEGARYASIRLSKGAVASQYAINRVELREHPTNIEHQMRSLLIRDDFNAPQIGELAWARYDIAGHVVASKVDGSSTFGTWSELGVVRLTTGVTSGYGGVIHLEQLAAGAPPVGTELRVKVKLQDTTNITAWLGLWSAITTYPDEAGSNTIQGIGFRNQAAGSGENWFGVVRDNSGQTTVDLGVTGGSWRNLGFYRTSTGIQFTVKGVATGSEVTANIPSTPQLVPIIGCLTSTSASKEMDIDFFVMQAFLDRL